MVNNLNCINHILFQPLYNQRNFENDLDCKSVSRAKRVALIALPFISLYNPAGKAISLTMGSARCITHFSQTLTAKKGYDRFIAFTHTTLAVASVAATLFHFQVALLITTGADLGKSLEQIAIQIKAKEYEKAMASCLQAASSMLYLAIILQGSLEMTLASLLLQGALCLYQARFEFIAGRWPEAVAKLTMGLIRGYQANSTITLIQRRNEFIRLEKFATLMKQAEKGRAVGHLLNSPLHQSKGEIVLVDDKGNRYNFGEYFSLHGKGTVKGMNLQFRTVNDRKEIDFTINHVFRDRLQTIIEGLQGFTPEEMKDLLTITNSHAKGITIEKVPFKICQETDQTISDGYQIRFENLGTVLVGASPDCPGIYDKVRLVVDDSKTLYALHEMLSFLNLDDTFRASSQEDLERLKMGQLFRIFYPTQATVLERSSTYFDLPVDQLKCKMVESVPEMQAIFDTHLSHMKMEEIMPGKLRLSVPKLSQMAHEKGARALVASMSGGYERVAYERVASILKMGLLSSDVRYRNGLQIQGLSSNMDFYTGGADSVYTQLLTEKNFSDKMSLDQLGYWGEVRILISLDSLNSGTYQYHDDSYGSRNLNLTLGSTPYAARPNILEFSETEQHHFHATNEVMIKERLDPSKIIGFVVPTEASREALVSVLRNQGLVQKDESGRETVLNHYVDQFIHIANRLSERMLVESG